MSYSPDAFDDFEFERPPSPPRFALSVWDVFSILVLIVTACLGAYYLLIFITPTTPLNPFPPQRAQAVDLLPTPTATLLEMPPTWTPSATPYIPPTNTPLPSFTPVFTFTPVALTPPTATPRPSPTLRPGPTPRAPYSAKVEYIPSSKYRPEFGCNWLGVAGIVLDKNGAHHLYLIIRLKGTLNGEAINYVVASGFAPLLYGPSGFEIQLGTTPVDSKQTLFLQLLDQAGLPLSENVYINTYSDCEKNMVFVTFRENR